MVIGTAPGELRSGLKAISAALKVEKPFRAAFLDRSGKRKTQSNSAFFAERNWPLGSDEVSLSTCGVLPVELAHGEVRILVRVSPHDDNWASSAQTVNDGITVRGVRGGRTSAERCAELWLPGKRPNFVEVATRLKDDDRPALMLGKVAKEMVDAGVLPIYGTVDLVPSSVTPCYRGHHWQQELLLVSNNLSRAPLVEASAGCVLDREHHAVVTVNGRIGMHVLKNAGLTLLHDLPHGVEVWSRQDQPAVILERPLG